MFHQTNWNFPMVRVTRTKIYCGWQGNIGGCCTKNRIPFFDKCSIDPEAISTVHKYRAEYGVHAYEKLAERCKELLEEQES